MEEMGFLDWKAGWVIEDDVLLWRLTMEFEEDGVKVAKTQIDCIPNNYVIAKLNRRAEQGLAVLGEGVIRECVRGAADQLKHQILKGNAMAQNGMTISLSEDMAVDVLISSARVGPYDGKDKILYLGEVPRIITYLQRESHGRLSPSQRRRVDQYLRVKKSKYLDQPTPTELVPVTLSEGDPFHFYVDESGDVGFKDGSSEYYTVAFVCLLESQKGAVVARLREILDQHMPAGMTEIKFSRVDKYSEQRKNRIYRDCVSLVRKIPLILYAFAVHKNGFVLEKARSQMAAYYYGMESVPELESLFDAENMKEYPRELLRFWGASNLPVVMMKRMIDEGRTGMVFYDQTQWEWKNEVLRQGFGETLRLAPRAAEVFFGVKCDIEIPLILPHSHEEPVLWLAELAAREVNKLLLGTPSWIDGLTPAFAGAGPFPDGHFIGLVDKHGRYTFYNLITKRIELILPD